MASRLEKLPPELLLYAAEFITRPSDLKALCLTCKILRDCALPPLYHTVVLGDRGGYWKPSIPGKGLLLVGNHGLVHVRRLDIPGAIRYKHGKFDDAGLQYLRLLLLIMPRNVLRSFKCPHLFRLDESIIYAILAHQTKLESLALGSIKCNFAHLLQTNSLSWVGLKVLEIPSYVGGNDFEAYQYIIDRAPCLTALKIRCYGQLKAKEEEESDGVGSLLHENLLSRVTFSVKMKLTRISFEYITIHLDPSALFDLSSLRSLCIRECSGSDRFLSAMGVEVSEHGCALREFTYEARTRFHFAEVETLLTSFKGLKKLHLNCHREDTQRRFDLDCLGGHMETLEELVLGCCHIDERHSEKLDLDLSIFTPSCFPRLQQLAVPMPPIAIHCTAEPPILDYVKTFRSLMSLPSLHVLMILNWPRAIQGTFAKACQANNVRNQKAFMHDLDDFFNANLCKLIDKAAIVGYLARHKNPTYDRSSVRVDLQPACYVVEKRTDPFGNSRTSAFRTTLSQARYTKPNMFLRKWVF